MAAALDVGMSGHAYIEIANVRKRYPVRTGAPVLALDGITFDVAEGQFLVLVGPSGCGKSTLMQILTGILPPSEGEVRLRGERILAPRRDLGVVFQEPVLLPWRTVLDNVMLPAIIHGLDQTTYRRRALDLLSLVKLDGCDKLYPYELSGGMQQRVAIARALINDPALILMDEPFGALDALTREEMNLELLAIWARAKKTIVLITHSITEAVFLADRIVVLSARPGRVLDTIDIDLPRPRSLDMLSMPAFAAASARIRSHLMARASASATVGGIAG